jgi:hypothetical protein
MLNKNTLGTLKLNFGFFLQDFDLHFCLSIFGGWSIKFHVHCGTSYKSTATTDKICMTSQIIIFSIYFSYFSIFETKKKRSGQIIQEIYLLIVLSLS